MDRNQAAHQSLDGMKKIGASEAQVVCSVSTKEELNFAYGKISLLRSTNDYSLSLSAIREGRKAQLGLNQLNVSAIENACGELKALGEAGTPDSAFGFSKLAVKKEFRHGPQEPDFAKMRLRMDEFLHSVRERHPSVILEEGFLDHVRSDTTCLNSHGSEFRVSHGNYGMLLVFSAKSGTRTSGFNYTHGQLASLDTPLLDQFGAAEILLQATGQLDKRSVPGKFTGELMITPQCLGELLDAYLGYLADSPMINGTSIFRDKLGEKIASPLLSVRSEPRSPLLAMHEFFDAEGFEAEPMDLLENGVLKSFLLSLYGANKTGKPRAKSSGSRLDVKAGDQSHNELLRSMKRGILLCRFSGGRPSLNGDFSGVAKNSYYVENGEIRYPVSETMVSGNLVQLFDSVRGVSRERIAFGTKILPWILGEGVTVSGK